jgi:hypothetical protein
VISLSSSTFQKIKLWTVLLFTMVTTGLWWHSFVKIIIHPFASHDMLSPVDFLSMLGYFATLRTDIPTRYYFKIRWIIISLVLLQFAASAVALGLFYKSHGTAPQYSVVSSFDLSPFHCDVHALLFDPTNTTYLVSLGASPILLGYGLLLVALCLAAWLQFRIKVVTATVGYIYVILTIFSLISLAIVGQRETNPIAWDPGCGLVHIMMGSGYGYIDVQGPQALQIVKTLFGIHW